MEYEKVAELLEMCGDQSLPEQAPDHYINMFAKALGNTILQSDKVRVALETTIIDKERSRPFPPSHSFHSLLRLFQMDHLDDTGYPYDDETTWVSTVGEWLNDSATLDRTTTGLLIWNIGSDVETRVAGPKLVAHSLRPERTVSVDNPYSILSIGSARDHSLAALSCNMVLPEIVIDTPLKNKEEAGFFNQCVNRLLEKQITIGDCYGVDFWPLTDEQWSRFLEACRFYPSELKDEEKRARYDRLEFIRDQDPRLHHTRADFSEIDGDPSPENGWLQGIGEDDEYDMVIFSTCLYQNYPEKRTEMFNNALDRLKNDGLVVVQDFVKKQRGPKNTDPIRQIEFVGPTFKPFTYRTLVYDATKPENGLTEFMRWDNGRCEAYRPAPLMLDAIPSTVLD